MPREKRIFVTFAEVCSTSEDGQALFHHPPSKQQHPPLAIHLSCEEELPHWIRDWGRQERQRFGQQSLVSNAVARVVQGWHRKGKEFL